MSQYIDGYLIPVPRAKMSEYEKLAKKASEIWKEHGALEYIEAIGDDYPVCVEGAKKAPEQIGAMDGEVLIFSYIVYESREHRDAVNAKVMSDPRMEEVCPAGKDVFDVKRMIFGGFRVIISSSNLGAGVKS